MTVPAVKTEAAGDIPKTPEVAEAAAAAKTEAAPEVAGTEAAAKTKAEDTAPTHHVAHTSTIVHTAVYGTAAAETETAQEVDEAAGTVEEAEDAAFGTEDGPPKKRKLHAENSVPDLDDGGTALTSNESGDTLEEVQTSFHPSCDADL